MTEDVQNEDAEAVERAFPGEDKRRILDEAQAIREIELARLFRMASEKQQNLVIETLYEMVMKG